MKPLFRRPTRLTAPPRPPEPATIPAPPALEDNQGGAPLQMMLPLIGALSAVVMMVVLRNGQPLFLVLAAVIFVVAVVGGIGFALSSRGRKARAARERRELYLDYLERFRAKLREDARQDRSRAIVVHPAPIALPGLINDPSRRWERRRTDDDYLSARIGVASHPWFGLTVGAEESPLEPADPILLREAELVARTMSDVPEMPVTADLEGASVVSIVGPRDASLGITRALVAQLATAHTPDDLALAAAYDSQRAPDWHGFDLLPHVQDPVLFDGPLPARRIAPDVGALGEVLSGELNLRANTAMGLQRHGRNDNPRPRLIVILDDNGKSPALIRSPDPHLSLQDLNVTVIRLVDDRLNEPDNVDVRITMGDGSSATLTTDAGGPSPRDVVFTADNSSQRSLETLARTMAALRTVRAVRNEKGETESFDVTRLLGIKDISEVDPNQLWKPRTPSAFLRVPFAVDDDGRPVFLDLKESAQEGMGPHGICVGATGSGKSEMLRTLLLSLALAHPPEDLSFILVDFKGGAAFSPFQGLPHNAGLIDNLADDPQLTTRARASLQGEVVRRQQLLKEADSSPSITHYRELRRARPELAPMPHLFVVIDEFGELLTAEPDFIDLFLQIGRIGRSIGIHLLLSSQRIEAGKLRGLDTYLSYRLGLRTFSESESQIVLGTTDAYRLPAAPGNGILKVDTSLYQSFRAGYVSGPVPVASRRVATDLSHARVLKVPLYNGVEEPSEAIPDHPTLTVPETGNTLIDEAVLRMRADDRAVVSAWLPPLPDSLALGQVLGDSSEDLSLETVIGLVDDPAKQKQDPWRLNLTQGGGHLAIVGSPQSGRTTLLRTIAVSFALSRTPTQVAIYGMDLSGGGLTRVEAFPHVGGVATRNDPGHLRRLIEEIQAMMTDREKIFKELGIDSMSRLRDRHAKGHIPQLTSADVVVLVDGYGSLRQDFEDLEPSFTAIMLRAASFGIHLIVTLNRWSELRIAHQSLFGTRIEMHLNDPSESTIDRTLARTISPATPGRALMGDKLLAHVALPSLELTSDEDLSDELQALAERVAESWQGPFAAPIRLLPHDLDPESLPHAVDEPDSVPFGLRQDTMATAFWEFKDSDQHLLVLGDAKSGKSTTLRMIAAGLIERYTPDELAIAVIDSRGHVAEVIPDAYLAAHARSATQAAGLATSIATELSRRPQLSADDLVASPRVVVLVDDHDIINAGGTEHLTALVSHLPTARDSKFHVVAARPVAGSVRALYGPLLQGMRDTGASVLLMSGDRSEGQILPRLYAERFPPGRGRYVRRGERPHIVQVANLAGRLGRT